MLSHLEELNLSDNQIYSTNNLRSLTTLKKLDLNENYINSVSSLRTLLNLEELNLRGNKIKDITGMWELRNLNYLNLSGNPIFEQLKKHYHKIQGAYDELLDLNDFLNKLPTLLSQIKKHT